MAKTPSLYHQMHRAIERSFTPGVSKHDMEDHERQSRIFNYGYRQHLNDFASEFGRSIKEAHPDVKYIKDIKPEYINEYLQDKADKGCTQNYIKTLASYAAKIGSLSSDMYNTDIN